MKTKNKQRYSVSIIYWISTGFIALLWAFGGVSSLMKASSSMEVFQHLRYPAYFATILGTAQLLGVAAILAPVPRTLREWAYAGLTFDVATAIASLIAIGSPIMQLSFPTLAMAMLFTSYSTWRKVLKLERDKVNA